MRLVPSSGRLSDDGAAIARSLHDPEAFAEVFDRHFAFVYRYVARRAGRDRADDIAAQTFTVAFSHRGRYRDDLGTARPWLLGIATNLLRASARSDQRVSSVVERLGSEAVSSSSGASPAGASSAPEDDDRLTTALERLDSGQREARREEEPCLTNSSTSWSACVRTDRMWPDPTTRPSPPHERS